MKELDSKQRAFVLYAAKVLKCNSPEELDKKLQGLSEDELNNLVQSFDQLYNQQMENNTIMARLGSKLNYIQKLNNKCPEGYEIEYYQAGGNVVTTCKRCAQKGAIPMAAKKNGGVAKDIKAEIAKCGCKTKKKKAENGTVLDKCGGKAKKKKMQEGGDMTNPKVRPSQDHAWDPDIKRWVFRPAGDGKPQNRVLESSKNDSTKTTTKKITPKQAKKASENIKKHLNGGLIQKYQGGGPTRQVTTSQYDFDQSIFNSKNRRNYNVGKGTIDTQRGTYYIPIGEDATVYAPNIQEIINSQNKKLNSTKSLVSTNTTPNLGGGLYQWMTENGLQSLASFQTRKKLAANYGIPNYIGTAQQNADLQRLMQNDLKTHINIADRLNY